MEDRYFFRAKRTDNGEWKIGHIVISYSLASIIVPLSNGNFKWYDVDPSTICQCTGLKDKNGQNIWENDIIKHYNDTSHPEKYDMGIVKWDNNNIRFDRTSTELKENVRMNADCVYEVIGNIFDNPKLLDR